MATFNYDTEIRARRSPGTQAAYDEEGRAMRGMAEDAHRVNQEMERDAQSAAKSMQSAFSAIGGGVGGSIGGLVAGTADPLVGAVELAQASFAAQMEGMKERNAGLSEMMAAPFSVLPTIAHTKGGDAARSFFHGWEEAYRGTQDMMGGGLVKSLPIVGDIFKGLQDTLTAPFRLAGSVIGGVIDGVAAGLRGLWEIISKVGEVAWEAFTKVGEILREGVVKGLEVAGIGLAALTGLLIKSTEAWADEQQAIAMVVGGWHLAGDELANMTDKLHQFGDALALSTGAKATDAIGGLRTFTRMGHDVASAMTEVSASQALADATGGSLATTTSLTAQVMRQFHLAAGDANTIVNTLAATTDRTNLSLDDIAQMMEQSGAIAHQFGMSFAETVATLGQLDRAGLTGRQAVMALRMAFADLTEQSPMGEGILKKYGLALADINPATVGFADSLEKIRNAGMSSADMMEIFGKRSGAAIMILASQGKAGLHSMEAEITGTSTAFDKQSAMLNTIAGQWKILKEEGAVALADIGKGFSGGGENWLKSIVDGVKGFVTSGGFEKIGENFRKSVDVITDTVRRLVGLAGVKGGSLMDTILAGIEAAPALLQRAGDWLVHLGGIVAAVFPAAKAAVIDSAKSIWEWLAVKVPEGIDFLITGLGKVGMFAIGAAQQVEGFARTVASAIGGIVVLIGNAMHDLAVALIALGQFSAGAKVWKAGTSTQAAGGKMAAWGDEDKSQWSAKYDTARTWMNNQGAAFQNEARAPFGIPAGGYNDTNRPGEPQSPWAVGKQGWDNVHDAYGKATNPNGWESERTTRLAQDLVDDLFRAMKRAIAENSTNNDRYLRQATMGGAT